MNLENRTYRALLFLAACLVLACNDPSAEDDGGHAGMDAGVRPDAAAPDGGTTTSPDGGPTDADVPDGGPADSGSLPVDAAPADGGPSDGGASDGGTVGDGVACGEAVCIGGDVCCIVLVPSAEATCMPPDDCEAAALTCDGPEDCGGGSACCLITSGAPPMVNVGTACSMRDDEACRAEFCHTDEDCSDPSLSCCPSPFGFGNVCMPEACP